MLASSLLLCTCHVAQAQVTTTPITQSQPDCKSACDQSRFQSVAIDVASAGNPGPTSKISEKSALELASLLVGKAPLQTSPPPTSAKLVRITCDPIPFQFLSAKDRLAWHVRAPYTVSLASVEPEQSTGPESAWKGFIELFMDAESGDLIVARLLRDGFDSAIDGAPGPWWYTARMQLDNGREVWDALSPGMPKSSIAQVLESIRAQALVDPWRYTEIECRRVQSRQIGLPKDLAQSHWVVNFRGDRLAKAQDMVISGPVGMTETHRNAIRNDYLTQLMNSASTVNVNDARSESAVISTVPVPWLCNAEFCGYMASRNWNETSCKDVVASIMKEDQQ